MKKTFQKITVAGCLINNGMVLIVRRAQTESFLPGFYELPGGKVDFGEDPSLSLIREFKEEVNLDIEIVKPFRTFSYLSENGRRHTVEIVYLVELKDAVKNIKLSKDHDDYKWVTLSDMKKLKIDKVIEKSIRNGLKLS